MKIILFLLFLFTTLIVSAQDIELIGTGYFRHYTRANIAGPLDKDEVILRLEDGFHVHHNGEITLLKDIFDELANYKYPPSFRNPSPEYISFSNGNYILNMESDDFIYMFSLDGAIDTLTTYFDDDDGVFIFGEHIIDGIRRARFNYPIGEQAKEAKFNVNFPEPFLDIDNLQAYILKDRLVFEAISIEEANRDNQTNSIAILSEFNHDITPIYNSLKYNIFGVPIIDHNDNIFIYEFNQDGDDRLLKYENNAMIEVEYQLGKDRIIRETKSSNNTTIVLMQNKEIYKFDNGNFELIYDGGEYSNLRLEFINDFNFYFSNNEDLYVWNNISGLVSVENENNTKFNVFPNPFTHEITINLDEINLNINSIKILDFNGNNVFEQTINSNSKSINIQLKDVPSGTYFVKIGDTIEKIIKN